MKTVEAYHQRTSVEKVKIEVEEELKKQTMFLFSILEAEYEKNKNILSKDALQERLKDIVNATRYSKTGYFWINDLDAVVLGVSPDDTLMHRKFIDKYDLTITLLSDVSKKICEDYKVWQLKQFMGKEFMGVVRTTFIIDPDGKLAAIWPKVSVRKKKSVKGEKIEILHVDEVKEKLQELQSK